MDRVSYGNVFFVHSCLFLSISDERKFLAAGLHSVLNDRGFWSIRPKKNELQQNRRLDWLFLQGLLCRYVDHWRNLVFLHHFLSWEYDRNPIMVLLAYIIFFELFYLSFLWIDLATYVCNEKASAFRVRSPQIPDWIQIICSHFCSHYNGCSNNFCIFSSQFHINWKKIFHFRTSFGKIKHQTKEVYKFFDAILLIVRTNYLCAFHFILRLPGILRSAWLLRLLQ